MYLNLDKMTLARRLAVMEWLWENGAAPWIKRAPVVVRGNIAEYTEVQLDDKGKPIRRVGDWVTRRRRVRVRTRLRLAGV